MGHWCQIVSNDFHEHAMTDMMVLRKEYALVFGPSDARKPCQGRGHPRDYLVEKGCLQNLEGVLATWKGLTTFPKRLCSREGKVRNFFFLVIIIPDGIICTSRVYPRTMN